MSRTRTGKREEVEKDCYDERHPVKTKIQKIIKRVESERINIFEMVNMGRVCMLE